MSLPALGGEGEGCGLQGALKGLYQTSEWAPGGHMVVPISRARCSIRQLGSPVLFGPTLVPKDFGVEKRLKSLPAPSLPPGDAAQAQPRASVGGVGVWAKATGEARGKQGQDTAVASRAARSLLS